MLRTVLICMLASCALGAEYQAPAGDRPVNPRPGAITVLPGGRLLDPHGLEYSTGSGPLGLAVNPKGNYIVTADSGPDNFSLTVLERDDRRLYRVRRINPPKPGAKDENQHSWRKVFMGVAFADDQEVFVSEGDAGQVRRIDITKQNGVGQLYELNRDGYRDSYSGELVYDRARQLLYVVDQANQRVVVIDEKRRRSIASVRTGRLPYAATLSPDGKRLYVTNVGMFEYKPLAGVLEFPAFGFPSPEALAGLGDPNVDEANSVSVIDVSDPEQPKVMGFVRTGRAVGADSHGGSSPSGVVATSERIYVSNAHNDSVTVIDARTLQVAGEIPIRVPGLESLRGVLPAGMALHPGTGWLFIAEAGINAVGVIDTKSNQLLGHIPAAWYPFAVAVHGDDVFVTSALGLGDGANANKMTAVRSRTSRIGRGRVAVFPTPARRELDGLTQRVLETNGFIEQRRAEPPAYPPEVTHVVLIVKESRSFDEVFGDVSDIRGDTVDGAPMLARFGTTGSAADAGGGFQRRFSLRAVNVTPNHHALAKRWSLSDNFYSDAMTSVEAHHWLAGVPPNPWTLSATLAAYGGNRSFRMPTTAPGRLTFAEDHASVHPEAIPERGTLWDHLERNGISFLNFGEGFDLAGSQRGEGFEPTGARFLTNVPMPDALYRNTSRSYPTCNTDIPDQYRVDRFIEEIHSRYRQPGKDLPRLLYIHLPNDEMALARPEDGYPFTASFVADNDYALGRIVQYLSNTPWWKNMVILVTEDEAHGGVDHVDARRVPFIAVGPYVRRNYVSHRNVSFPGLLKTVFGLLGVEPLHLLDAAATDLSDLFSTEPDFTPYGVLDIRKELFVPAEAKAATPAK